MRAEFRGPSGSRQAIDAAPLFATATAGGTLVPGQLVKASGNPFTVVAAGDGEAVYGVCRSSAVSGETVTVLVQGITTLTATGGASWASHRRVCAASGTTVDEGSPNDPWFGTLLSHDGTTAVVLVHGDAMPALARGVRAADGTTFPFGTLTADQPLVLRSGRSESVRPIGTTAQIPSSPYNGQTYYDTDVGMMLVYDGTLWRSAEQIRIEFGALRSSITSNELQFIGGQPSTDAGLPYQFPYAAKITNAIFRQRGGTGGKTWTPSIRLNGSGSADWAGTGQSSTTSWATYRETLTKTYAADDRLRAIVTNAGTAENHQAQLTLIGYFTP